MNKKHRPTNEERAERRKRDKDWINYALRRIASYWLLALFVVPFFLALEWFGLRIIAVYMMSLLVGFSLGAEVILGSVRNLCIKNNIDFKTFKKLGVE